MTITDILDELGIPYRRAGEHHHVTEGWVGIDCVSCSPGSGRFKMGISLNGWVATCWSCGTHGIVRAIQDAANVPWQTLAPLLKHLRQPEHIPKLQYGKLVLPPGLVGELLPAHQEYLRSRGFDPAELERLWWVKGIGIAPRLGWSIFIPVIHRGKVVSWTTRAIAEEVQGRRYITAHPNQEAYPAKSVLYGGDYLRHAVIVTEGPFDVFRVGPGAVATLGTSYSREQVWLLAQIPVRCICFDSEHHAQQRAKQLCSELSVFPGTTTRVELDAEDPGSASKQEIRRLRKHFLGE